MKKTILVCLAILAVSHLALAQERFDIKDISFNAKCDGTPQRYIRLLASDFDESKAHDLIIGLHGHGSDRWRSPGSRSGPHSRDRDAKAVCRP